MQFLKAGTAAVIKFGPFVDKADGVTLKADATTITDIDHATTGIFLSKNGADAAVRHQSVTASVADDYGMMTVTLDTTDTNTVGTLDVLFAKAATYLPVHKSFMVIPASLWDTLMVAQPAAAILKFFDKASPTGTVNSLPDAVPGANGGLPTTNGTKVSQTVDLTAGQEIAANLTKVNGAAQTATLDTIKAAIPTAVENADALLKRDWTSVTGEAARSVLNALRFLRNKWTLTASTLSVKKEDDTTEAWNGAVTTDAAAVPVVGNDPT